VISARFREHARRAPLTQNPGYATVLNALRYDTIRCWVFNF